MIDEPLLTEVEFRSLFKDQGNAVEMTSPVGAATAPRRVPAQDKKEEDGPPPAATPPSEKKISAKKVLANQLMVRPELCEMGAMQYGVFDLSKESQIDALNGIMAEATMENPTVMIERTLEQFCDSLQNWKILLRYRRITYKDIINE